ncbi:hypothetical protein [Reticulibacter mediterranei]|uniref:hypothetical protein n=1 Tax=Reticulibacter mediterranei TaxID=2778369 RepID=UPI00403295E9
MIIQAILGDVAMGGFAFERLKSHPIAHACQDVSLVTMSGFAFERLKYTAHQAIPRGFVDVAMSRFALERLKFDFQLMADQDAKSSNEPLRA